MAGREVKVVGLAPSLAGEHIMETAPTWLELEAESKINRDGPGYNHKGLIPQ